MYYGNVTFMLCMPRSRSYWLSKLFGGGFADGNYGTKAFHEPLSNCESIKELGALIDGHLCAHQTRPMFIADTSAVFFFDSIVQRFPRCKFLVVKRNYHDVYTSLEKAGFSPTPSSLMLSFNALNRCVHKLRQGHNYSFETHYHSLNNNLMDIWRFVGDVADPTHLFPWMIDTNLQRTMQELSRDTNPAKVERLFKTKDSKL